jgi:hypothetical protein
LLFSPSSVNIYNFAIVGGAGTLSKALNIFVIAQPLQSSITVNNRAFTYLALYIF